ncbi:EamA family transporter [Micromonospora sp. BQ11]|uniref:EamA family transporter n=1 Tax=Micromonospora sp. BQ11 TaxID=3452212 RepID=UPI003F89DDD8
MRARHVLLAVAVTAVWGLNFSVIKLGLARIDPFVLAGIRFTLCALPAVLLVGKPDVAWRYTAGYGLVFGVGLWGLVNLGIAAGVSPGIASLVLQTSVLFTMALGAVVLREAVTRYTYVGATVAFTGLACVTFVSDGSVGLAGLGLVVTGAAAWSVANLIVKKSGGSNMLAFLVWSSLFSPVPLFALAYLSHGWAAYTEAWHNLDVTAVAAVLFQVYPVTILGYWAWNRLLRRYPLAQVAPFSLLVPVFGLSGSVLLFHERLPFMKLVAMTLIVAGLAIGQLGQQRHATPVRTQEAS